MPDKKKCIYCNRSLIKFKDNDWDKRKMHKKCYFEWLEIRFLISDFRND